VPYFKYAVDRALFGATLEQCYGIPPIGIGWSKSRGGMHYLFRFLTQYETAEFQWFAAEGDFTKLDFSMAPGLLTIVGLLMLFFYNPNEPDYDVLRYLAEWSTDDLVSKFLHLFDGEDRLVIGMMFSGSLLTSWGDSVSCWIAFEMWYLHVYTELVRTGQTREAAHWRSIWPLPLLIYGDDHVAYLPSYAYPYYVGKPWEERELGDKPQYLDAYLGQVANIRLKMPDSAVYFADDRHPLCTVVAQTGQILHHGPKFLQRRWVLAKVPDFVQEQRPSAEKFAFLAFRPTEDYFTKAATTVNGDSLPYYILKLRGLAVDTAGANRAAFMFLRFVHNNLCQHYPSVVEEIALLSLDTDPGTADYRKRLTPNGLPLGYCKRAFPDYADLKVHFWPDRLDVNLCMLRAKSTGFYSRMNDSF